MTECIPARLRNGEIAEGSSATKIARQALIEREGPPPTPKHVCRHLCVNDSQCHKRVDGFVCVLHTVWGTQLENVNDIEKRRIAPMTAGQREAVSAHGKIVCNLEHTCPHCGRSGIGPAFKGHINKRKCARPQ